MFTDDLDEAIYQARLAARRRDEHIRAEGAVNALDVAGPRIREMEAEVQRLNAIIAELREENAVFVDASRRLAALEAENGRLKEPVADIARRVCSQCSSEMDGIGFEARGEGRVVFRCPKCGHVTKGATRNEWQQFMQTLAQQPKPTQDKEQP